MTYNASKVMEGFLTSLLQQTYSNFALYITDNGSSDQTLAQIDRYEDPRIHTCRSRENLGWAEGINRGLRQALADSCDLILLINNDTEFEPRLLEKLATGLDRHTCHMIVPKILFFDDPKMLWRAGGTFNRWRGYTPTHRGVFQIDRGQFDEPRQVEHGPACCLLVRRQVFEQIGLLDGRFFLGVDDADFCYRAMKAGFKLFCLPSAQLLHKASSSTGGIGSEVSSRYNTRGHVIYMLKHFGIRCGFYLPAYQINLVTQLVTGKINLSRFFLREKAFFEGIKVWRQTKRKTRNGKLSSETLLM